MEVNLKAFEALALWRYIQYKKIANAYFISDDKLSFKKWNRKTKLINDRRDENIIAIEKENINLLIDAICKTEHENNPHIITQQEVDDFRKL